MTDPYKVLNVRQNCTIEQLRESFKKVALKVHPDKGGNEALFNIVIESYKTIYKSIKNEKGDKDFTALRKEFNEEKNKNSSKKNVSFANNDEEEFQSKFNKMFEDNKFSDDAIDGGYGHFMTQSNKTREDIDIKKHVHNFKDFNTTFDNQEVMNKDVIIFKEPEALTLSKSLAYDELGVGKISDYSSDTTNNTNLGYCDYMKAHTTNKLVDARYVKKKQDYKNIEDLEKQRTSQGFEINERDRKHIEEQIKKTDDHEAKRRINVENSDKNIEKHFHSVNQYMINNKK